MSPKLTNLSMFCFAMDGRHLAFYPEQRHRTLQTRKFIRNNVFHLFVLACLFACLPESLAIICYQCSSYGLPPPPTQRGSVFIVNSSTDQSISSPVDPTGCYEVNTTTPLIDCPPTSLHCLTAYGIYAGQPVITRGCGTALTLEQDLVASTDQQRQRFFNRNQRLQPLLTTLSNIHENGCRILQLAISCKCNATNACNGQSLLDLRSRARVHLALAAPVGADEFQHLQQLQSDQEGQLDRQLYSFQHRSSLPTEATPLALPLTAGSADRRSASSRFARILYSYDTDGRPVIVSASSQPALVNGQANEVVYTPSTQSSENVSSASTLHHGAVGNALSDSQADALMSEAIRRNLMSKQQTDLPVSTTTPSTTMIARNVFVVSVSPADAELTTSGTPRSSFQTESSPSSLRADEKPNDQNAIITLTESSQNSTPLTTSTSSTTSTYHGDYNNLAPDAISSASNVKRLAPLEALNDTTTTTTETLDTKPLSVSIVSSHGDITEPPSTTTTLSNTSTPLTNQDSDRIVVEITPNSTAAPLPQSQEIKASSPNTVQNAAIANLKSVAPLASAGFCLAIAVLSLFCTRF